ncbi:unnamed protein product [Moneuplotes crassus]|uniref:Uncharacterized protein n=1 Tax=Euplotes crassus TaxID=5936 RepID=A0AAD1XNW5_EUPCR|nr:unnamed protein product [Moneuplotes crassus]
MEIRNWMPSWVQKKGVADCKEGRVLKEEIRFCDKWDLCLSKSFKGFRINVDAVKRITAVCNKFEYVIGNDWIRTGIERFDTEEVERESVLVLEVDKRRPKRYLKEKLSSFENLCLGSIHIRSSKNREYFSICSVSKFIVKN